MSALDTSSKRIKWDEEAIAEHDKERGTRQKIDEPPTPFAYESDGDSVDSDIWQYNHPESDITENIFHVSQEVTKKEDEEFKNKRASHYNEFKVLLALSAKMEVEDEDDDDDDDDDEDDDEGDQEVESSVDMQIPSNIYSSKKK